MELAAVAIDPIIWSILWALAQNVLGLIQNSPHDRVTVVRFVQGKVMDVMRLLERMERNPNFGVDATITSNLQFALEALKMELTRVLKLNGVMYSMQAKRCKDSLAKRVGHVDSVLTSLNTELVLSLRDQQEVVERTRLQEENARLANERLLGQVTVGGPRQDNVLAPDHPPREMQKTAQESSERVPNLVPYIIPHVNVTLAEENAQESSERVPNLVPYIIPHVNVTLAEENAQESSERVPNLVPYIIPHVNVTLAEEENAGRLGTFPMLGLEQEGREEAYYARAVAVIDEGSSGLGVPVPFIHHRDHHMCGQCARRIVGIRFHSRHIPDYDLCEECFRGSGVNLRFFLEE